MTPEGRRAMDAANMTFPHAHRGKFFRDAARRLAKCTGISYDAALGYLQSAAVSAAYQVALQQIEANEAKKVEP